VHFRIFRKLWRTRGAPTQFGATVWKLLIIEPKLNKIESENSIGIWGGILGVVGKPLVSQI
jgi:hypothetical protein